MNPYLVCDFDGTICLSDVGDRFFEHFTPEPLRGEWAALTGAYDAGQLGSRECLERECALVRLTRKDAEDFADQFRIEPSFPRLVEACRARGIGMSVVSDGMDVYIRRILDQAGLQGLPVLANHAVFEGDVLRPEFPWAGAGCGRCGNCKGNQVARLKEEHSPVVMIGDARSDLCGALEADRVFARETLAGLLREQGRIPETFETFDDIIRAMQLDGSASTSC